MEQPLLRPRTMVSRTLQWVHTRRSPNGSRRASTINFASAKATTAYLAVALLAACRKDAPTASVVPPAVADQVAQVVVTATRQVLAPGDTLRLSAQVFDALGRVLPTQAITWSSGASNVARIDAQGLVTAVGEGSVVIDASAGGKTGQANLVVTVVELCDCTRILDSTQVTLQQRNDTTGVYVFRVLRGAPPPIDSGAIIVGIQNGGFLRRVVRRTTSGDRITLQTRIAYVEEAVRKGGFGTTIDSPNETVITQSRAPATWWGPWETVQMANGVRQTASGLRLDGLQIAAKKEKGAISGTLTFAVKQGEIVFDPRIDLGASFGFFKLQQFHAIVGVDMGLNLDKYEFKLEVSGGIKPDSATAEKLQKESVSFITQFRPFVTFIGPMPVVGRVIKTIKLEVTPTVSGSVAFSGKFRTGFGVTAGFRYNAESGFSPANSASSYFEATPPALDAVEASASVKIALVPDVTVELYGVGGPFVNLEPYAEATAKASIGFTDFKPSAIDWETYLGLGLNLNVGLKATLLGFIDLQAGWQIPLVQPYTITQAFSDGPLKVQVATVGGVPAPYTLQLSPDFVPREARFGRNHETSYQTVGVASNASVQLDNVRSGSSYPHLLSLANVPGNCAADSLPRQVAVASKAFIVTGGAPTSVKLNVNCIATGALALRASVTGPDRPERLSATLLRRDTVGVGKATTPLTVQVPAAAAQADIVIDDLIPKNPANGATGELGVSLAPGRRNCAVASPASKVALIQSADTVDINFRITCVALGHLKFLTPLVDADPSPTSSAVQFTPLVVPELAGDSADRLTTTPAAIVAGIPGIVSGLVPLYNASGARGRYRVSLSGGPNRCSGAGQARITAFPGDTAIVDFPVKCVERLHVKTITAGPGADPDGYRVRVESPDGTHLTVPIDADTTLGIAGVSAGSHMIQLVDVDPSCVNPPAVTRKVSGSDSTLVVFQVSCPAPAAPEKLRATLIGSTRVDLAWEPPSSGTPVAFYRIYRNGVRIDTTTAIAFSSTSLTPFTAFVFQVSAVNPNGLEGAKRRLVVKTRDATPPSAPAGLVGTPSGGNRIDLQWQPATDGESQIAEYVINRDGKEVGRSKGTTFFDLGLTPGTTYTYTVYAINGDSLRGPLSNPASASTNDLTPPTPPASLSAQAVSSTRIDLSWGKAIDVESGVVAYRVYRNGTLVGTSSALTFSDSLLTPNTSYTYTVRAVNAGGLQGAPSQPASATTLPDGSPPSAPSGLRATVISSTRIDLAWVAAVDPESGIQRYNILRDGALVASTTALVFSDTGLTPSTSYTYTVTAVNGGSLQGPPSAPAVAVTLSDLSPPTAPSGLTAVAVSTSQINLAWVAASDPQSGIKHYNIYRDGALVATASTTTFADQGLSPSATYVYEVTAVNGSNVEGPRTLPASAKTLGPAGSGDIRVVTTTIGNATSGYLLRVTGTGVSLTQPTAPSATVTFTGLLPQAYTVQLQNLPTGCVADDGPSSRTVTVTAGSVVQVNFIVACT